MNIFTVGNEKNYDEGIKQKQNKFKKLGQRNNYPGGFACQTIKDAHKLIKEFNKQDEWAVYELNANWNTDTIPSLNGWWHALIHDSIIIKKHESSQ